MRRIRGTCSSLSSISATKCRCSASRTARPIWRPTSLAESPGLMLGGPPSYVRRGDGCSRSSCLLLLVVPDECRDKLIHTAPRGVGERIELPEIRARYLLVEQPHA